MSVEAEEITVWEGATRALAGHPVFGPLVERVGPVRMTATRVSPFAYLVRSIVFQQLAGAAARTIHGRVQAAVGGGVTPDTVAAASDEELRGAGLSGGKLAAIRDLTDKARSGEVSLDDLDELDDDAIVARLVRVRGVGPWTAQMFLMFRLHRPDVWPTADLGVRQGYARLHGLDAVPPKDLMMRGDGYRPWRSAVAWYCWRALEVDV